MKIFVSIASYQDPLLKYTIESIIENARYKKNLVLGIFDQSVEYLEVEKEYGKYGPEIRYKTCHPKEAKGVCWARSTIQKELFDGEDIYMQIDSHTLFEKDWDERLITQYELASTRWDKPLITGYPRGFEVIVGDGILSSSEYFFRRNYDNDFTTHIIQAKAQNSADAKTPYFNHDGKSLMNQQVGLSKPAGQYNGFLLAGGFIFVSGEWIKEVPYDPEIYFNGEEPTLALRSFTKGWNIVHVPFVPVWHYYNTEKNELKRNCHWDGVKDTRPLTQKANKKVDLVLSGKDYGEYGIGHVRSLKEYTDISGIDYINKTIQPDKATGNNMFCYLETEGLE